MKNKLILLLGASGTGKSTLEGILEKRLGFKRVISHTTRPIREGETQGMTYHFIDDVAFEVYKQQGAFLETTSYNNWQYGINKHDVDLSKDSYIAVIEPYGYRQLVESLGKENIISILITVDGKERLLRALNREEHPNCREICRRYIADLDLFEGIEKEVDGIIENDKDINKTLNKIIEFISYNFI